MIMSAYEGTITALPVELLLGIFRIHVASHRYSRYPYKWIAITHVCRFWRELAIHQGPDLWDRIVVLRPDCVQAMLERSKNTPLSVQVGSRYWSPAVQHLIPHLHRIRSLELQGPFVRYDEFAHKSATPMLEELYLIGYRYAFTDCIFCSTLKHLEIRGTSDFACLRDSAKKLLTAFARMVMLETVILESATLLLPLSIHENHDVTYMTHLKSFDLIESASSCTFLLEHLSFPASTAIRLQCLGDSFGPEVQSLIRVATSRLNGEGHKSLTHFEADIQEDVWSFYAWNSDPPSSSENLPIDPNFTLQISTQRAHVRDLTKICRKLPLHEVHTVTIRSCCVHDALALLGETSGQSRNITGISLFPKLGTLVLQDLVRKGDKEENGFTALSKYLIGRRFKSVPIASVVLWRCYGIKQEVVSLLMDTVETLSWNGDLIARRT